MGRSALFVREASSSTTIAPTLWRLPAYVGPGFPSPMTIHVSLTTSKYAVRSPSVVAMISDLVLGTMYFGTRTDEQTSFTLLDRFVEAGGRTIDTANCYSFWSRESGAGGQSEETIGRWLAARPGMRDRVEIATKVGVEPVDASNHAAGVEGLSPEVIARACERSLERLGVDRIDLYGAHGEDRSTDITATAEAMSPSAARTTASGS